MKQTNGSRKMFDESKIAKEVDETTFTSYVFYRTLTPHVVRILYTLGISPHQITFLNFLMIPIFSYYFICKQYIAVAIILVLTNFIDTLDGGLARATNRITNFGRLFDGWTDTLTMLTFFGITALTYNRFLGVVALVIVGSSYTLANIKLLTKHELKSKKSPFFYYWLGRGVNLTIFHGLQSQKYWLALGLIMGLLDVALVYCIVTAGGATIYHLVRDYKAELVPNNTDIGGKE